MGQAKYQNDGDPRTSGPGFGVTCHEDLLADPLTWRRPRTVFVNSMSDIAHARVPRAFVAQTWAVMALARQHTFQVLTKRPKRLAAMMAGPGFARQIGQAATEIISRTPHGVWRTDMTGWTPEGSTGDCVWMPPWPLPNTWVGTSIETDDYTWRADVLRQVPASTRFLSLEPLLGPLPSLDLTGIDWVIVGGESGPDHRPVDMAWIREIRDRCLGAGVPFFFKQVGGSTPKAGGRELDGRTWDQYPTKMIGGRPSCPATARSSR
ncbi:MAG TPA: DUF5131 family protein, partial [Streptosporangiaceae bacterium]|jgi:protein gp37|nr:DUF5131 family protein [Streptosporangiaceae bacterium]